MTLITCFFKVISLENISNICSSSSSSFIFQIKTSKMLFGVRGGCAIADHVLWLKVSTICNEKSLNSECWTNSSKFCQIFHFHVSLSPLIWAKFQWNRYPQIAQISLSNKIFIQRQVKSLFNLYRLEFHFKNQL